MTGHEKGWGEAIQEIQAHLVIFTRKELTVSVREVKA
jgi:hypothetical protein